MWKRRDNDTGRQLASCEVTFPHSILIRAGTSAEETKKKARQRDGRGQMEVKVGHNSLRQAARISITSGRVAGAANE